MPTQAAVKSCATTACSFNADGCSAFAVTISGSGAATCGTFVELDARGGLPTASGQVGACQHLECSHNTDLMCSAEGVEVGAQAECLAYDPR